MAVYATKKMLIGIISLLITLSVNTALAKTINLYDQPNPSAKSVGSIDSNKPLVPIFTTKDGDWMKVGNPDNGVVGWVKVSDLGSNSGNGFSFSQQTIETSSGPKTTIQFGVPHEMTPAQINAMQKRQAELQESIQRMSDEMQRSFANMPAGVPVFMPVIVVPSIGFTPPAPPKAKPAIDADKPQAPSQATVPNSPVKKTLPLPPAP